MAKPRKSSKRDKSGSVSRISDARALFDVLREARLNRQLSQHELAGKLGWHQRQISDVERAAVDPRLSTIQNVARALDLELMLIPRHLISAVEGLQRSGGDSAKQPMYALGEDDAESDLADQEPK